MFCFIYKWMISWVLDSGKGLPGAVKRHIDFSHQANTGCPWISPKKS
jgi:hypothetical protein